MKKREDRIEKNIRVLLKDDDQNYPGTLINFSKSGMATSCSHLFSNGLLRINQESSTVSPEALS